MPNRKLNLQTAQIEEVRSVFRERGVSVAEWSRQRGFSVSLVYAVLAGRRQGVRGQSHEIALALKLKQGVPGGLEMMPF